MKNLPAALIFEKNKLATANPWLVTLDVTFPAPASTVLYLVANTEDITYDGNLYTRFSFKLDVVDSGANGEIPTVKLLISNVLRLMQAYLEELGGAVGSTVLLRWINAGLLSETYTELELSFEVLEAASDAQWCTFTLGSANLLRQNFPAATYRAGHCRFVRHFKGAECAYAGAETTCDGRLSTCRSYGNSVRYGGFPGLSGGGVRLA